MSKVKTTIYLVLFLALVNIATSIKLRAQTTTQIDVETTPIINKNAAKKQCPGVCIAKGLTFNGNWDHKFRGTTKYAVCGCNQTRPPIEVSTFVFKNNNQAQSLCPGVCKGKGLTFTGHWDNILSAKPRHAVCQCK